MILTRRKSRLWLPAICVLPDTVWFVGAVPLPANGIVAPPLVTPDGSMLLTVGAGLVRAIDTTALAVTKTLSITTSAAAFGAALAADGLSTMSTPAR